MNRKEYNKITKKILPNKFNLKNLFVAFISGGIVGILGEIILRLYLLIPNISMAEAVNLMMVTIIYLSSLFTALGFFDKLVSKYKAGLIVPITGFSHSTTSSAIEYRKEGLVSGIGSNIFKLSGSVILYGVVSAYTFGIIRYIFFGG